MFTTNNKKTKLTKLLLLTEKKFGRGSSAKWRNKDFEDLCFSIHVETKILISPGTLKRVFGKTKTAEDYFPQEATITALENYTGFDLYPAAPTKKPKLSRQKKYFFTSLVALLLVLIFAGILINQNKKLPTGNIALRKIDGTSPATVYFDYEHSPSDDSIFISYGDDSKPQYLQNEQGKISHYFRYPGIFTANLRTRDSIISNKVDFIVPTQGLQVLAFYLDQTYEERYFPVPIKTNCKSGNFQLSRQYISSLGMDTTRIVVVRMDNYSKSEHSGDSFKLETRLSNGAFWPAIRCYSAYLRVAGERGNILFKFFNQGCSQFNEFFIGERNYRNMDFDPTVFSINMAAWNSIQIENRDKHVTVRVNDQVIFDNSYNVSIGKIIGSTIKFHGIGSVDYFHLTDSNGQAILCEDFD